MVRMSRPFVPQFHSLETLASTLMQELMEGMRNMKQTESLLQTELLLSFEVQELVSQQPSSENRSSRNSCSSLSTLFKEEKNQICKQPEHHIAISLQPPRTITESTL